MSHPHPDYDGWRPIAPQIKWLIVGIVVLLLGAWELLFHLTLMGLPMITGHQLNALVAAGLVTITVLGFFALIQGYERDLAYKMRALQERTEVLGALEAKRDTRLLDLARDLALALVAITDQCEVALQFPSAINAPEILAEVKVRAHDLYEVQRALVALERDGTGVTRYLPAILEDYERRRPTRPAASEAQPVSASAGVVQPNAGLSTRHTRSHSGQ